MTDTGTATAATGSFSPVHFGIQARLPGHFAGIGALAPVALAIIAALALQVTVKDPPLKLLKAVL